jgi:hypothetical protein
MKFLNLTKSIGVFAAGAMALSASNAFSAAGQLTGSLNLSKSGTLFDIGNSNAGGALWTTGRVTTTHNGPSSFQQTDAMLDFDARFLKKTIKLLDGDSVSKIWRDNNGSRWELNATLKVIGLATIAPPSWPRTGDDHYGDTGVKSYNMDFFSASASYPVGPIALTISGKANGGINLRTYSQKGVVNNATYLQDWGRTYVYSGANINGQGSVSAGIPWLASGGVTATVNIINGWVNAENWADRIEYKNNAASNKILYRGNLNSDAAASMGAGKLEAWVELIGIDVSRSTLASWGGYTIASKKLFSQAKEEYFAK